MSVLLFPSQAIPFRTDAIDRAKYGGAGAPLSREQKRYLILAAQQAYRVQGELGLLPDGETFDAFRHREAFGACGVGGFRTMLQRHFVAALARFGELAGRDVARLRMREVGDGKRRALGKLDHECRSLADAFGSAEEARAYADRLSLAMLRCPLTHADERGVWRVVFTLRHRGQQLSRKAGSVQ